ncbi:MAG: tryptophan--tRNA ligase [Saprospiraceae bacterium]|nr:tryptophan--tRNA ligase [Saprospiraceae bacterium]
MKRILSGIQPTGDLHLGNYFGAIKNWVDLQGNYECNYGVVDYHSMTMPYKADNLKKNTWQMVFQLLACGVREENLFIQSLIPEHAELTWILSCVCSYGELTRMTQFKDKTDQAKEQSKDAVVSSGLLFYPILMASDILLYHADYVPIGKDQEQHLELSRNIATRFNYIFNTEYFQHPEPLFTEIPKLLSPANPEKKMSKSLGEKHYINLFGEEKVITKQIKSAVTDSGEVSSGTMSPGVKNLFELLKACGNTEAYNYHMEQWESGSRQYGALKGDVAASIVALTAPFHLRLEELKNRESEIKDQVYESSALIRKKAQKTMDEVREITGLTTISR